MERWPSGLRRTPGKRVCASTRRFESCPLRQLGNVFVGSPSARARQPILSANRDIHYVDEERKTAEQFIKMLDSFDPRKARISKDLKNDNGQSKSSI